MFFMNNFLRFDLSSVACMHGSDEYHGPRGSWWGVSRMIHDELETRCLVVPRGP